MPEQPNSAESKRGPYVPLGWVALVIGTLLLLGWFVADLGLILDLIHTKPPAFLYPTGLALVVCGYIACFALPRLHQRVEKLEQRLDALTNGTAEQREPGDQP